MEPTSPPSPTVAHVLRSAGASRRPLTAQEQLEALRRVKAQAEARLKLGVKLFQAAEAHTTQYRELVEQVRSDQEKFREQWGEEVARSLRSYDQWIGRLDETFQAALSAMGQRIDAMEARWSEALEKMDRAARRAESMFEQVRLHQERAAMRQHRVPPTATAQPVIDVGPSPAAASAASPSPSPASAPGNTPSPRSQPEIPAAPSDPPAAGEPALYTRLLGELRPGPSTHEPTTSD